MANPQPDKFTRISNELLDALARFPLPGCERQIFDAIMRRTYGYNCKAARIPLADLEKSTSIPRHNIPRILRRLEARHMITIARARTGSILSIQKDFDQWQVVSPMIVSPMIVSPGIVSLVTGDSITGENTPGITGDTTTSKTVSLKDKKIKSKDKNHKDTPAWEAAGRVLEYLNGKVGSHYRDAEKIHARLTQQKFPATEAECIAVIDDQWERDYMREHAKEYMTADTLFGPKKFEKYRGQLGMKAGGNGQAVDPLPERIPVSEIGKQAVEKIYANLAEQRRQRDGSVPEPPEGPGH